MRERSYACGRAGLDAHAVERPVHEERRDDEEDRGEHAAQPRTALVGERYCQLYGEQPEQGRELDDWVECDGRRVLEWIADRITHDRRRVQRRAFLLELDLDDLLRVVPRAAGVRHEDRL